MQYDTGHEIKAREPVLSHDLRMRRRGSHVQQYADVSDDNDEQDHDKEASFVFAIDRLRVRFLVHKSEQANNKDLHVVLNGMFKEAGKNVWRVYRLRDNPKFSQAVRVQNVDLWKTEECVAASAFIDDLPAMGSGMSAALAFCWQNVKTFEWLRELLFYKDFFNKWVRRENGPD
jgi:hypothetical protein